MKIRMSFLFGIIASVLCLCESKAEEMQICPEGCFCIDGGSFLHTTQPAASYCGKGVPKLEGNALRNRSNMLIPNPFTDSRDITDDYVLDEMYYAYKADGGETYIDYYGVKNGTFYESKSDRFRNIHACPEIYPYSAKGSITLSDCFKYDTNGNKTYYDGSINYRSCDIESTKAAVERLQHALNKAAQDLQDALDKVNSMNNAKTSNNASSNNSSNNDIDTMKAMIDAGMSTTSVSSKTVDKKPFKRKL